MTDLMYDRLIKAFKHSEIKSQKELANKVGMSTSTICRLFSRERDLNASELAKICEVLNVSSDYILALGHNDEPHFIGGFNKEEVSYLKQLVREDIIKDSSDSKKWDIIDKLALLKEV